MGSRASRSCPVDKGLDQVDDALETLFGDILDTLANSDAFSQPASPSSFVVYAHNSPEKGIANAEYVDCLIQWLKRLRSRTLSDRSPVLSQSSREEDTTALENILSNQFCLLPASRHAGDRKITSVDKVIVCGSSLLESYYQNEFTPHYVSRIQELYDHFQHKTRDELQKEIRSFVETQCKKEGFHHVLTELAFVALRRTQDDKCHGIIPVALHENSVGYLPFLKASDHYIKLKSPKDPSSLHKLFFSLLQRVYIEEHERIDIFRTCYTEARKRLENRPSTESQTIIKEEISKALDRWLQHRNAATRGNGSDHRILSHLDATTQDSKRAKFLNDLSALPYQDRKNRNPERVEGTCVWFTNHRLFSRWQHSESSCLLWVSANPGCGKSVLARHLVDSVLPTNDKRATCYFFFKDDFEDQKTVQNALRCLLHQLFLQRPALLIDEILKRSEEDRHLLSSFTGLWNILVRVAGREEAGEIICILDALDECQGSDQFQLSSALIELYNNEETRFRLKFLLTSRPYSHIQRNFQILKDRQPTIHLSGENKEESDEISREISIVIKAKAKEMATRLKLQDEEEDALQKELRLSPNRTYLWVYLVFEVIYNSIGITRSWFRENLRKLPQTVEAAYEKILCKSLDPERARKLLHIVVAAVRPLSLREMAIALNIQKHHVSLAQLDFEPEDRFGETIRALCGLFVTIVDSKIYLLHQTAREFLIRETSFDTPNSHNNNNSSWIWKHSFGLTSSNFILAEICIWYYRLVASNDVFEDYAAMNWAAHFRKVEGIKRKELAPLAVQLCDPSSERSSVWFELYWHKTEQRGYPEGATAPIIASYFGLEEVVRLLLEQKSDLSSRDRTFKRSALSWACGNGHENVVETLLNQRNWTQTCIDTLLHCGITSKILFRERLVKHAFVDSKDRYGWTPLYHAAVAGSGNIVKSLIENKANFKTGALLELSVEYGHEAIVRLLLERGVDTKFEYWKPLHRAAEYDRLTIMKLLLDKGAEIEAGDDKKQTPLHYAAMDNSLAVAKLLLDKGANIEAKDFSGSTPLHRAAGAGRMAAVELLLDKGANIEARNGCYCTPLHYAVVYISLTTVELLLDRGADIEAKNFTGRTSLSWDVHGPVDDKIIEIKKLLLARGANIEVLDNNGNTPLLHAVKKNHFKTVKLLLESGANIAAKNNRGGTALSLTSPKHRDMWRLLLENGAQAAERS